MRMTAVVLPVLLASACATPAPPRPAAGASAESRCAVWAREMAFADALAAHDHAAFAAHLHPDAVFGVAGPAVLRGRATITREWAALIDGTALRLAWYPTHVTLNAAGDLAYSTGPALLERVGPEPAPRLSSYQSVWQRAADGQWYVLFDGGTAPREATTAQVAAFHAGRKRTCTADPTDPSPR